jgi:hypothetical protein
MTTLGPRVDKQPSSSSSRDAGRLALGLWTCKSRVKLRMQCGAWMASMAGVCRSPTRRQTVAVTLAVDAAGAPSAVLAATGAHWHAIECCAVGVITASVKRFDKSTLKHCATV